MNHEAIEEQVALPRNKDDPGINIPNKRQSQVGVIAVFEEGVEVIAICLIFFYQKAQAAGNYAPGTY